MPFLDLQCDKTENVLKMYSVARPGLGAGTAGRNANPIASHRGRQWSEHTVYTLTFELSSPLWKYTATK
jgi:hypothetical protein